VAEDLMFIFPMMGISDRFRRAGYQEPKFMLPLCDETVFHHVVRSFSNYFDTDEFLFIAPNQVRHTTFIEQVLRELRVHYRLTTLDHPTQGQAQTVALGLAATGVKECEEIYLFNIDTIRPGFTKPQPETVGDAWLEVFHGEGNHWSFILSGQECRVLRTTEKDRISDLCSDGLYYFRQKIWFDKAYQNATCTQQTTNGEYYIAPLYNYLIDQGLCVRYGLIDTEQVIFCGTPNDYKALLANEPRLAKFLLECSQRQKST
jgi:hypothetical protein